MTADTRYSREALESVIAMLHAFADRRETKVYRIECLQAAAFLEAHLDDEDVVTAEQVYFNDK